MRRRTPWLVALVLAVLAIGVVWYRSQRVVAGDGDQQVRRAWTEGRRVALHGRQTVMMPDRYGKPITVEAEVLASGDGKVRIRYLTTPLQGVVIWESGTHTWRFSPRRKRITIATRRDLSDDAHADEAQLLQNYTARIVRRESVAKREAVVIELRPKSQSDRWKLLSIDMKTGVVLASEERKGRSDVLRSSRFTQIRYLSPNEAPPATAFQPTEAQLKQYGTAILGDTSSKFDLEALSNLVDFKVRLPKRVPHGYTLRGAYQTPCPCDSHHQAARLEYKDGLNGITFIECGHPTHPEGSDCFRAGSVADDGDRKGAEITASVTRRIKGVLWHFLAVGDAPRSELEQMVQSAAE